MLTTIVVDNKYRDTAAKEVLSMLSQRGAAKLVNLSEFLTHAGVKFDEETGYLSWNKAIFSKRFPDPDLHRICNRVITISNSTSAELEGKRGVLTPNLVFYSYAKVLKQFSTVWGEPGMYSPVGNLLPLNLQWRLFASRIKEVSTPKFAYGFGFASIDTHDFRQPIWKSPFDLYGWKPEEVDHNRIHPFVVDRPSGAPVFLYFIGASAEVFTRDIGSVDTQTATKLLECAGPMREMFGAFMGEALFFAEGNRLTFGAFSHYLKTSLSDSRFPEVLARGLSQCDA